MRLHIAKIVYLGTLDQGLAAIAAYPELSHVTLEATRDEPPEPDAVACWIAVDRHAIAEGATGSVEQVEHALADAGMRVLRRSFEVFP